MITMVYEYRDYDTLKEFDHHIEQGKVVHVDEYGSDNRYNAVVKEFLEKADDKISDYAKIYKGEIAKVHEGEYNEGDEVKVDNREVVRIYEKDEVS